MQVDETQFEIIELSAQLVETNRQFAEALKANRPYFELVKLYSEKHAIYSQINTLKEQRRITA